MKFSELVKLAKDNNVYAGDIEFGPNDDFIGFVYFKNNKYQDSEELAIQFAVPIQAEK